MLQSLVSCLFFLLFLTSLNLGFNEVERFISNVYLKGSDMLYQDLSDLYAQFIASDDMPVNEVNSAIATYAEENDLLFTEVLENLYTEYKQATLV